MNRIAEDAFATMARHLGDAAVELFASYAMAVTPTGGHGDGQLGVDLPGAGDSSVLGVIGYVGDKVRGALVLVTSRSAIESWHAAMGGLEQTDVCDTLGEFSNMLLGHLKGRLLPEGFPILLSTPTTASVGELRIPRAIPPSTVVSLEGPGWRLDVRLDATFEEGFSLQDASERTVAVRAGEVMLF
jgi:CheY-specific phosphatase CheX